MNSQLSDRTAVAASVPDANKATTSTPATRLLGFAALGGIAALVLFALVLTPADQNQGESVRMLYLHAPSAWIAYLAFGITAVASALYLFPPKHSLGWDRLAGASAEVGVLFMAITLMAGMLWGRLTWGVFWRWDARITTTAFLFVTYIGYLAVRRLGGTADQRARRSGVLALLAVLEIPLVHFSVVLWRPLHQEASVANPTGDVEMDGLMLFSLFIGIIAFTMLYMWLLLHQQRVLAMEDAIDDRGLDLALAERAKEGT
ncbi:MAG: cytochrome c biogenesis protein CcsA [Ilumatobacteraceae bacterium]